MTIIYTNAREYVFQTELDSYNMTGGYKDCAREFGFGLNGLTTCSASGV
jgi:hypothetical protein